MQLKDQILWRLAQPQLKRNAAFKGRHQGESCYIFGNGASLKSMDLDRFSDRVSISCNSFFFHRDFGKLNCLYYHLPAAFLFYRYRKYYGAWYRNYIGDLFRRKIGENPKTRFFTSLSNCLNMRGENVYYTHHFGSRTWDFQKTALDGEFSFMQGGLYAMLGMAAYFGFTNAILVGCDYAFTPRYGSHFFEKGLGQPVYEDESPYGGDIFERCQERMDLTLLVPDGVQSNLMKTVSYSEYTGRPMEYKENLDIIDGHDLAYLAKQGYYNIY
ncbi:MAG: hypothetical protein MO847_04430 [Candidatus Protistobacter heckmanni]|nr:hypothetical protein [Candidatus Protistobacter heckmanni]